MLSISDPSTAGKLSNYFKKDDYYTKEKGEWQGKCAETLGLTGEVKREDFQAVLEGRHPETGVQLREKKGAKVRSGMDLTFSAPKSASILSLADGRIKELHDKAVETTLNYIEKNNIQSREQIEGSRKIFHTENAIFAKFNHLTSRELDPQLHTHCVLMNLTEISDHKFRAIHNDTIYQDAIKLGQIYRNEYANLLQKNGYAIEVTSRKDGFFEIKGVDEKLIKAFSSRREQIEKKVEEYDKAGKFSDLERAKLFEIAALGSRAAKSDSVDKEELKASWFEVIKETGTSLEEMKIASRMTSKERQNFFAMNQTDHHVEKASNLITDYEAVFKKNEIVAETARLSLGKNSLSSIEQSFLKHQDAGNILNLGEKEGSNNSIKYFSTIEMKKMEDAVLEFVNASKNKYTPHFSKEEVGRFLDIKDITRNWNFTMGQRDSVLTILTSPDQTNIIQGDAGTGKTTYLKEIKALLDQKKLSVLGVGFTGKSASELKKVGIEASTIHFLLNQEIEFVESGKANLSIADRVKLFLKKPDEKSENKFQIEKGSILIIDEASMTGNKHFYDLLKLAEKGNLKVVIQGDKKQLPSIAAGRMHDILQNKTTVDKVHLNESVRQNKFSEKDPEKVSDAYENIQAFKQNGMDGFIANLNDQGNIIHNTRKDLLTEELKKTYLESRKKGSVLILVDKNDLREKINLKIRKELLKTGEVSKKGYGFEVLSPATITSKDAIYANTYEPGQQILLHEQIGIFSKGSYGIEEIDNEKNLISLKNSNGIIRTINVGRYGGKFLTYDIAEKEFSKGDEVVFLKNDRKLGVENGNIGVIKSIDKKGNLSVEIDKDKTVKFNLKDDSNGLKYNYIDYSYAVTVHKSQGTTVDQTIYFHDGRTGIPSANSIYVAMTRSRSMTKIFTQSKELLKKHSNKWLQKTSTLDPYINREDLFSFKKLDLNEEKMNPALTGQIRKSGPEMKDKNRNAKSFSIENELQI